MKTVIFDMDGVLVNSERMHFQALDRTLQAHGIALTWEYFAQFIGSTIPHMWEVIARDYHLNTELVRQMHAQYMMNQWYFIERDGHLPVDGAQELVRSLFAAGYRLAVASSSSEQQIAEIVDALGIRGCFTALISGETVPHPKPEPDIFLSAADTLGVQPADCVVIEDSAHGVAAAKAAGMFCIGLRNPDSGEQDLSAADRTVSALRDICVDSFPTV